eukprot:TRINITY_DN51945_c0_g1_i1.p1 TRINITY_DN51945_c0_g1~~TRINITY_DN51945_c0_g1_i1.p1  ORF type:complete len:336 (+),score=28.08 TRINITY_DN51945_c0_g1_i1:151-1008(+)
MGDSPLMSAVWVVVAVTVVVQGGLSEFLLHHLGLLNASESNQTRGHSRVRKYRQKLVPHLCRTDAVGINRHRWQKHVRQLLSLADSLYGKRWTVDVVNAQPHTALSAAAAAIGDRSRSTMERNREMSLRAQPGCHPIVAALQSPRVDLSDTVLSTPLLNESLITPRWMGKDDESRRDSVFSQPPVHRRLGSMAKLEHAVRIEGGMNDDPTRTNIATVDGTDWSDSSSSYYSSDDNGGGDSAPSTKKQPEQEDYTPPLAAPAAPRVVPKLSLGGLGKPKAADGGDG